MKKLIALLLTATMLFAFAAAASADGMVDKIKANGKIVVGTEATYPELALETINGNIVGFVVDQAVGESMVASSNGQLEAANFTFTKEEASFGKAAVLAKGQEDLLDAVNEVIDRVVSDGSYQAAYDAAVAATGTEE